MSTKKSYGVNELRQMFLDYFESKGHLVMKSFSLVPHNDNSLLLINSGMAPLKPYFTGQETPPRLRMATCQKCIRTGDIENVGKTARHGTFFEMLGNFSFGDYFKKESIAWTWEFLTKVVGLDPDRLYPSVYLDDDEAFDIWHQQENIPKERIYRFGKADNFWEHGSGPCGPCSEVYYDRGEKFGCGKSDCTVGCDCDRYMEVWNNVFTQFDSDGQGNYAELEKKNIDTGMGLERLAAVVQEVDSIFDVDTVRALREKVCEIADVSYKSDEITDISIRLITDHIRSATFMISDGIMPSNEGRGYVLRRIIRRAARHGKLLGIGHTFLAHLSATVIDGSKDGYPELSEKKDFILNVLTQEENKFYQNIEQGLSLLKSYMQHTDGADESDLKVLDGASAFKLYDTYGFPLDLTKEICAESGVGIDEAGFNRLMEEQRDRARKARKATNYMGADATVYEELPIDLTSQFVGYDQLTFDGEICALTSEDAVEPALTEGQRGTIIVSKTPFYAAMGGQTGDRGTISAKDGEFKVEDTIKLAGEKIGHVGVVTRGQMFKGQAVRLTVDKALRNDTCKNHSATHLLHKALRVVLGTHVEQAGSFVSESRLRFDFSHFSPLSEDELKQVEAIVSEEIANALPVDTEVMNVEEAKKSGAMALFNEKYKDDVRVVKMGAFSMELCGGTHVSNTANIAAFHILSETGIAAGVRRIEAVTGRGVMEYMSGLESLLTQSAHLLKASAADVPQKIEQLLREKRGLQQELTGLKSAAASAAGGNLLLDVKEVNGIKRLVSQVSGLDMNGLKDLGDTLKEKLDGGVLVLISQNAGSVNLVAFAGEKAIAKGIKAGEIIKEIAPLVGGRGGGRETFAQAGGKDAAGIAAALTKAAELIGD